MASGRVKWFNDIKGYGFIECGDGTEVFVHYSSIEGDGHRTLSEGAEVEFDLYESQKGFLARNVHTPASRVW